MSRLSWNLGASNSWNPQGLSRPVMGLRYLYVCTYFSHRIGNPRHCWLQWRTQELFCSGGSTNSVEDRGQRERGSGGGSPPCQGFRSICKWENPIFLLGYGCIFHGTENSAQLCHNFRISGGGRFEPPKPPRYATDWLTKPSINHQSLFDNLDKADKIKLQRNNKC
jgi:hypothetical protein